MFALTTPVEKKDSYLFPENLVIMLDNSSAFDTLSLSIYERFTSYTELRYSLNLLQVYLWRKGETHSAKEHVSLIQFVLTIFAKGAHNIVVLMKDNCSTNTSVASLTNMIFLDAHDTDSTSKIKISFLHKKKTIHLVHLFMKKMNYPVRRAAHCLHTNLAPGTSNSTRRSSVSIMLRRYRDM